MSLTRRPAGPLVVIGDTLLDVDVDGTSERLCPDAPVPVIDVAQRRYRPGGAGLAALLAARDGTPVQLITALGTDAEAEILRELLSEVEVLALPLRGSTVVKTRIRLEAAPVLRLDHGVGRAGDGMLTGDAEAAIRDAGAVLVSDYGRGMCAQHEIRRHLTRIAATTPLVWDPHPRGAEPVPGCTVVTPNRAEAERVLPGVEQDERARRLCARWDVESVAITLGQAGAQLARRGGTTVRYPVAGSLQVLDGQGDVCGAGDRFAATVAQELCPGSDVEQAVPTAVETAARFVAAGGASAYASARAERTFDSTAPTSDVARLIERTRAHGGLVVATGGCFDLLHRGHVTLLERARSLGDLLIVCLNSDDSVRRAKGPDRPLVREADRARVLSSLSAVDAVVIFDEDTPAAVLERLRPDVWVKGDDYAGVAMPEAEVISRYGGRVELVPLVDGYSTTRLVSAARPSTLAI